MMQTQDPDIQSWTDNKIEVWVPSIDSVTTFRTAGSGQIKVKTATGAVSDLSTDALTIPYSVLNVRNLSGDPIPVGLASQNGSGGYTFTPDSTIDSIALGTITSAMNDWICQIGVNFKMGTALPGLTHNSSDSINAILFGTPDDGDLAQTFIAFYPSICYSTGSGVAAIRNMDMVISSDALGGLWDYTNNTTPASGKETLLGMVRHEFGHTCALNHVVTGTDLMYWEDLGAGVSALPISHDDQNGGLYVLTTVGPTVESGCFPINVQSFPSGCPTLVIENGIASVENNPFNISVYPNPFNQNITIQANLDHPSDVQVIMYDVLGQIAGLQDFGIQTGLFEKSIHVSLLSVGMYIVRVLIDNQSLQVKLIKK